MSLTKDDLKAMKEIVDTSIEASEKRIKKELIERIDKLDDDLSMQTAKGFEEVHKNLFQISSPGPKSPSFGHNPPWTRQRNYGYASSSRTNSGSKLDNFVLEERSGIGSKKIAGVDEHLSKVERIVIAEIDRADQQAVVIKRMRKALKAV